MFRFLVHEISKTLYTVISLDSTTGRPRQYVVRFTGRWTCNCPHFEKNKYDENFVCKHIIAVHKAIGRQVEVYKINNNNNNNIINNKIAKLEEEIEGIKADLEILFRASNL